MATTQIAQRQIADGAINNDKVAAGAGLVTTKLADGAEFIQRDGSVAMTGSLDSGNQTITNVATPSGSSDAATKGYVDSAIAALNSLYQSTGGKNRIVNGAMKVSQENGNTSGSASNYFPVDQFMHNYTANATVSIKQDTEVPAGFSSSIKATVNAYTSMEANEYYGIFQWIEGYNVADLNFGTADASDITISFWVKANATGTYCVNLRNSGFSRTQSQTFNINAINTWEKKKVTFSGDTAGTWLTSNNVGFRVGFTLACGAGFQTASNGVWLAANDLGANGQDNFLSSVGNQFWLTGVQLEKGTIATEFEHLPYWMDLSHCQRYYLKNLVEAGFIYMDGYVGAGQNYICSYHNFPVEMRTLPTATVNDANTIYFNVFTSDSITPISVSKSQAVSRVRNNSTGRFYVSLGTNDFFVFDARL